MQKPSKKTTPSAENLGRVHARAVQDLEAMTKRGMVYETDGVYRLFSDSLGRWVHHEITAAPDEQESTKTAEEWLDGGGRDNLKETKGVLPKFKKKYWPLLTTVAKELSFEFAAAGAMELIRLLL